MSGRTGKTETKSSNLNRLTYLSASLDENDLHNLEFLLTVSDEGYKAWHAQADHEDLDYAQELLIEYGLMMQEALGEVPFPEAQKLLKSFTK